MMMEYVRRIRRRFYTMLAGAIVLALASLVVPHIALAQSLPWQASPTPLPNSGALDGPLSGVGNLVSQWVPIMTTFAERVFFLLIVIDVFWMGAQYVLGNRENAGELLAQGALKVITFTIVFELVILHGYQFSQIIIGSFLQAGGQLPGLQMNWTFTQLLSQGLQVATPLIVQTLVYAFIPNILGPVGFTNLQLPLMYTELFGATAVVGAYVFMAGALALAWLEMYFVTCAGIVMLGFSGSRWSSSFGYEKYLMYSFSIGIKLLMTYIVIDIASDIGSSMIAGELVPGIGAIEAGFTASIMTMLVFNIPSFAAALIQGSSSSSAGAGFSAASQAQAAMMSIMQMASDALQRTTMELQTRTQDQLAAQTDAPGTQTLVGPGRDTVMATPAAPQTPLSAPGDEAMPPAGSQPAAYQPTPAVDGFLGAPPAAFNDISTGVAAMAADYFATNGRAGRDAVGRDGKDGESVMFGSNGNGKYGEEIEELRVVEPAPAPSPALTGFTPASFDLSSGFTEERLGELVRRYPEAFAAPDSLEFARPVLSDDAFARVTERATAASNDDVIDGRYTVVEPPSVDAAYVPGSMNAAAGVGTELSQPTGVSPEAADVGVGPAGGTPLQGGADAMDRPLSFVGKAPDASAAPTELSGTATFADGTRVNLGDASAASFSTPAAEFGNAPQSPEMVAAAPTSLSAPQSGGIGNESYATPFVQPVASAPATELAGASMASGSEPRVNTGDVSAASFATPPSGFGTAPEAPQMVSAPSGMGIESTVPPTSLSAPQSGGIGNESYATPFVQPVASAPATELAGSSMASGSEPRVNTGDVSSASFSTPSSGFGTAPEPPQMVAAASGIGIESAVPPTSLSAPQSTGIGNESYTTPVAQPAVSAPATELAGSSMASGSEPRVNLGDVSAASFSTPPSGFGTAPEPPQMVSAPSGMGIESTAPPTPLSAPQSTGLGNDSYAAPFAQPAAPAGELAGSSPGQSQGVPPAFESREQTYVAQPVTSSDNVRVNVGEMPLTSPASEAVGSGTSSGAMSASPSSASPSFAASPPTAENAGGFNTSDARVPNATPEAGVLGSPNGSSGAPALGNASVNLDDVNSASFTPTASGFGAAPDTREMVSASGGSQGVPLAFESREQTSVAQPVTSSDNVRVNVGEMPLSSPASETVGSGTSGGAMSASPSLAASPPIAENAGGFNTSEARIPNATPDAGVMGSTIGSSGAPALGNASVSLGDVNGASFTPTASGFGATPETREMVSASGGSQGVPAAFESREQTYAAQPVTSSDNVRVNVGEMPLDSPASEAVGSGMSSGAMSASPGQSQGVPPAFESREQTYVAQPVTSSDNARVNVGEMPLGSPPSEASGSGTSGGTIPASPSSASPSFAASPPTAENAGGFNTSDARIPNATPDAGVTGSTNGSSGAPALGNASVNLGDVNSASFAPTASGFGAAPETREMVSASGGSQGVSPAFESREQTYVAQPVTSSDNVRVNVGEMPLGSPPSEASGSGTSGGTIPASPSFAASPPIAENAGSFNASDARIPNATPDAGVTGSTNGSSGAPALGNASVNLGDVNSASFTPTASGFGATPETREMVSASSGSQGVPPTFESREQTYVAQPVTSSDNVRVNGGEMPLGSPPSEAGGSGTSGGTIPASPSSASPSFAASPPIAENAGGFSIPDARIANPTPDAGVTGSTNGSAGAPALGNASVNLGDVNSESFSPTASGFGAAPDTREMVSASGGPQGVPPAFESREQTYAAQPVTSANVRVNVGEIPLTSPASEIVGSGTSSGAMSTSPSSASPSLPTPESAGGLTTSDTRMPNATPEAGVTGSTNGSSGAPALGTPTLGNASVNLGDVNNASFSPTASGFQAAPESPQMVASAGQSQAVPPAFESREQPYVAQPVTSDNVRVNVGEMPLSSPASEAVGAGADSAGSRVGSAPGVSNGSSSSASFGEQIVPPIPSAKSPRISVDSATDGSRAGAALGTRDVAPPAVSIRLGNDANPVVAPTTTFTVTPSRQASEVSEFGDGSETSRTTSYRSSNGNGSGSGPSGNSDDLNGGAAFDGNRTAAYVPNANAATSADATPVASGARFVTSPSAPTNGAAGNPVPPPTAAIPPNAPNAGVPPPPVPQAAASPFGSSPTAVGARFTNDTAAPNVFGAKPEPPVRERSVERQIETRLTSSSEASASAENATFLKPDDPSGKWTEAEIRKMADAQLRALVDEREFSARPLDERVTLLVEADRRFGNDSERA